MHILNVLAWLESFANKQCHFEKNKQVGWCVNAVGSELRTVLEKKKGRPTSRLPSAGQTGSRGGGEDITPIDNHVAAIDSNFS